MNQIVILSSHYDWNISKINKKLLKSVENIEGIHLININDLYDNPENKLLDIKKQHAQLLKAKLILFQNSIHWYSSPYLYHRWICDVLDNQFRFELKGKDVLYSFTTGGSAHMYSPIGKHNFHFDDLVLRPYEQTAYLCGMNFHKPWKLMGIRRFSDEEQADIINKYILSYQKMLFYYIQNQIVIEQERACECGAVCSCQFH